MRTLRTLRTLSDSLQKGLYRLIDRIRIVDVLPHGALNCCASRLVAL